LWCRCSPSVARHARPTRFVLLAVHVMHLICAELLSASLKYGRESSLLLCLLHTVCPPGTFGLDCTLCTANSWCPGSEPGSGGAPALINSCGPNKVSAGGAKSALDCTCALGGWMRGWLVCMDQWSAQVVCAQALLCTLVVCVCMSAHTCLFAAPTTAENPSACAAAPSTVPAGYGGVACDQCPAGTYGPGGSTAPCLSCGPRRTTSLPGSTSPDACQCAAGQGLLLASDTICQTCPAGFYSPGPVANSAARAEGVAQLSQVTDLSACLRCPSGRVSPPGATSAEECGECEAWPVCVRV
jgi:hypothetical protein